LLVLASGRSGLGQQQARSKVFIDGLEDRRDRARSAAGGFDGTIGSIGLGRAIEILLRVVNAQDASSRGIWRRLVATYFFVMPIKKLSPLKPSVVNDRWWPGADVDDGPLTGNLM